MDGQRKFLDFLRREGLAEGNFLGLLNVLIGRRIEDSSGNLIANGLTWREVAQLLKKVRWPREAVLELGLNPSQLPPRHRERYWYTAISLARVDSPQATRAGDFLARLLETAGYHISRAPRSDAPT